VWAIGTNPVPGGYGIYQWTGSGWVAEPGAATDITIGANGSVWAIGTNPVPGGYGIYQWTGRGWARIPGGAMKIAIDVWGYPWVTNSRNQIYASGPLGIVVGQLVPPAN
jgi:hypothetical protein